MSNLKLYLIFVAIITEIIFVFGLAGPFLISSNSTFLVFVGYALIIVSLPVIFFFGNSARKEILRRFEEIVKE